MLSPARNFDDRKALVRGLINALIRNLSIETTEAKAAAIKGMVDNLITKAKKGSVAATREVSAFLDDATNVDRLVQQIAPTLKERAGGYTKLTKLGRRKGDNAMIVRIEFITKPVKEAVKAIAKKIEPSSKPVKLPVAKKAVKQLKRRAK